MICDRGLSDVAASDRWVEMGQRFLQKRLRRLLGLASSSRNILLWIFVTANFAFLWDFRLGKNPWEMDSQRHKVRPRPLSYLGAIRKSSPTRFSIRFSDKHPHRSGVKQNAVGKLNGISGAGVYVLRNDSPKLAGIVIEYHPRQSEIISTSAVALWEMMRQKSLQGT